MLALIFVSMPSRPASHAGPAVMPVRWVAPTQPQASPPAPTAHAQPARQRKVQARSGAMAAARPHRPHHDSLPASPVARATPQPAPVHAHKRLAKAKAVSLPPPARTAAPSPADMAASSAHDLDLVRRHLERFKFYPEDARRRGIGGNVDVGFRLTHGGQVAQVRIASSSGYALLDHAAEAIVARAVPFPVDRGHYRVRLRFWP